MMLTILQMNFEFQNSPAEAKEQGQNLAPAISQVPGLIWKIWLMDEATRQAGGIYLFESQTAADTYLNGAIAQTIQHHPDFANLQIRLTPIWAEASAVTANTVLSLPISV
ncbi:YdhR family protein [Egbenema bharatensis]|uniref:YdhR family protein n=1 Tax=Egbenema bharatensis TaxID=3463334 RepID=UPI003A8A2A6E